MEDEPPVSLIRPGPTKTPLDPGLKNLPLSPDTSGLGAGARPVVLLERPIGKLALIWAPTLLALGVALKLEENNDAAGLRND